MENISKTYDPKSFEKRLYNFWMDNNYFRAEVDENKKPFTIIMPPPNVTGNLHIGHALNNTLQDILTRWKRMSGYSALWLPGTDHASISTEVRVVDKLRREGKSKEMLGREKFLEEAWDWTHKYGNTITTQLKELGVSCDWSRQRFTLDETSNNAVYEVFIRLYNKGLIYRGHRIINWCPNCGTALSDAEVEHVETEGQIWYFNYPLVDDPNRHITIATTRPETILGDLAVAVNPDDERYKDLIGKMVLLPLQNKEIPIIADDYVDMEFGSGAVKITPSHDVNDFEVGERHNLGQFIILDEDAKINENGGKYCGMDRYEARKQIIEDFKELGLFNRAEKHNLSVGHCDRCDTVIEPLLSEQWFVSMKEMAEKTLKEFNENHSPKFYPDRFSKIYTHWLENIRDWTISRQLWWGHRIPVYYCQDCGEVIVSKTPPEKCSCGSTNIVQDEDTLDTWFSSALWAFSTLGWPEETEDLKYFFPTDVLVTSYDIIFFWVIRMVFSSLEQLDEVPFKDVLLNGLVRDDQGRKMSKSLDNGIDPLEIIDQYGADALRFSLITGNSPGNDMRFYHERVEAARNFANKLWNASRFVLMNTNEDTEIYNIEDIELKTEDKWILTELNHTIKGMNSKLDKYETGLAANDIYNYIWDDYCDWYIELVKPRLYSDDLEEKNRTISVLVYVLDKILKLLHPFMPFITEEIYQHLPNHGEALIIADWPVYDEDTIFADDSEGMQLIQNIIKNIRNIRAEMNIQNSKKTNTIIYTNDEFTRNAIETNKNHLISMGFSESVNIVNSKENLGDEYVSLVVDKSEVYLALAELVDFEQEIARLEKEKADVISEIKRATGKLNNVGFTSKAPEHVVEEERSKKKTYEEMLKNIEERITKLSESR
ncbi:MAG: valine--tRNA ligase [Tissierellia bacterium]|nr:valine--tRNA ligase [Tissierellia bacterium]